jgi:hypothetical protein
LALRHLTHELSGDFSDSNHNISFKGTFLSHSMELSMGGKARGFKKKSN